MYEDAAQQIMANSRIITQLIKNVSHIRHHCDVSLNHNLVQFSDQYSLRPNHY